MDNKKSYVYKIMCKITGEYYFGSSFYIMRNSYWGGGTKIRERVAQYGKENFIKEILGEFDDRTIAHQVENQYIEKFRHDDKCLNQHLDHKFGTYSDERCAKLSVSHRGKHHTDETRAKISAANLGNTNRRGKKLSDETRAKLSAAHRGKTLSEGHKAEISAAMRGKLCGKHWRKNPVTGKREWYD